MDGELDYLFNDKLTGGEIISLRNGEIICNSIGKLKYAKIKKIPETKELFQAIEAVNPNHLAEIIKILPYERYENITDIIDKMIESEESYTSVPFYTNEEGKIHYLYADAKILSLKIDESTGKKIITEKFLMRPLDYFEAQVESEQRNSYFFYQMKNTSRIKYKTFISAVGKKKMIAVISLFRYGDNWIIYALGGVDIIKLPFIDKAIDRAFFRRIKAFCFFTFEKLEESVSEDEEK